MKKQILILLSALSYVVNSKGQDSANLVFKNIKICLPSCKSMGRITTYDSLYYETIIEIGNGKYFYIKQKKQDTLAIESGQMGLYYMFNNSYLLREGIWALEGTSEKILFENFGRSGTLDEVKVQIQTETYEGVEKRRKRTIRRASKKGY